MNLLEDEPKKDELITVEGGWFIHNPIYETTSYGYKRRISSIGRTRVIPNGWKFNQLTRQYEVKKKAFTPNDED